MPPLALGLLVRKRHVAWGRLQEGRAGPEGGRGARWSENDVHWGRDLEGLGGLCSWGRKLQAAGGAPGSLELGVRGHRAVPGGPRQRKDPCSAMRRRGWTPPARPCCCWPRIAKGGGGWVRGARREGGHQSGPRAVGSGVQRGCSCVSHLTLFNHNLYAVKMDIMYIILYSGFYT